MKMNKEKFLKTELGSGMISEARTDEDLPLEPDER